MKRRLFSLAVLIITALLDMAALSSCSVLFDEESASETNTNNSSTDTPTTEIPTVGPAPSDTDAPTATPTETPTENPNETHTHTSKIVAGKAPTCTTTGLTAGAVCSECGDVITAQEEIAALGHEEVTVYGYVATCSSAGLTNGSKCNRCNETLTAQKPIEMLPHDWNEAYSYDDEYHWNKCSNCEVTTQKTAHSFGDTTVCLCGFGCDHENTTWTQTVDPTCHTLGKKIQTCNDCGAVVQTESIEKLAHTPGAAATCTVSQTCTICYAELSPALGHTAGADATCTADQLCRICNAILTPHTGHVIKIISGTPATCVQSGLTEGTECAVCHETLTSQVTIPATNIHTYDNNTDAECNICGFVRDTTPQYTLSFTSSGAQTSDSSAVITSGKIHTIVKPGIYTISGNMTDGQIRVEVAKTEKVTLLLNNFYGSCSDSGVIYVVSADKVDIDLAKGTTNVVTDAQNYVFDDPTQDKPNACIYSSEDLTIKGGGTLYVNGLYNNGIGSKNDLEIKNGVVYVSAVKNALKGNDSVTVCGDAIVNVEHANDALKSDTPATEKPGKGFVMITDTAIVNVKCDDEAIQATQNITITAGATLNVIQASKQYKCDGTVNIDDGCIITP